MLSQNELKYYSSLLHKKYRNETGKFIVEGKKLILEAINSRVDCEIIISTNTFYDSSTEYFSHPSVKLIRHETVKQLQFEKLSDTKTPQGVVGVFRIPPQKEISRNIKTIIALENISDPGNLGTIIRNCDWFGFSQIIISGDCAEIYSPKVIRSSAGSVFHVNVKKEKIFYDELKVLQNENYQILCSDIEGEDVCKYKFSDKFVAVFCNEANGPSEELLSICDAKITIPKKGKAESLNVASASAVILSSLANRLPISSK